MRIPLFKLADRTVVLVSLIMVLLYVCATTIFVRRNSHFIADDFDHFGDVVVKSLPEMLATRIDVHFVPFHQLASYLVFKFAPLNFDVALGVMIAGWIGGIALLYFVLRRLAPHRGALLIVLLVATSPVWLHILIWWSAAVHRIPYLLLQAATCLAYLRYRDSRRGIDALVCLAMQIIALGFYVKAILFPCVLVAIEVCVCFFSKRISREGIKLCIGMSMISALYVVWYLITSSTAHIGSELDAFGTLSITFHFVLRLAALLLFLPIEQVWAEWIAGVFWGGIACWSIWRSPRSALPIAALVALLFISFALTVMGRGALVSFPLAAMRYYSDEIFIVGIFIALIMAAHAGSSPKALSLEGRNCRILLLLAVFICYPVGAYYANRIVFLKAYEQHRLTHDFMIQLRRTLSAASDNPSPPVILHADFPAFVYGFMGMRKPMSEILGAVYPRLEWLKKAEQIRGDLYYIDNEGRLAVATLPADPDFKDDLSFLGWSAAEESHRWSSGYNATILFSLNPNHKYEGVLLVRGPVLGVQRVTVRLNGTVLANIRLDGAEQCCSWSVKFSPALLRADGLNMFEFDLPDARTPDNGDQRILAIGVEAFQVR